MATILRLLPTPSAPRSCVGGGAALSPGAGFISRLCGGLERSHTREFSVEAASFFLARMVGSGEPVPAGSAAPPSVVKRALPSPPLRRSSVELPIVAVLVAFTFEQLELSWLKSQNGYVNNQDDLFRVSDSSLFSMIMHFQKIYILMNFSIFTLSIL